MVDTNLQTLGLAAIVFVATGFIFLYLWVRLRRRRAELSSEPLPTRAVLEDRAYNQILLARSAAERLERSGVDTGGVETLLDKADLARSRGDPDNAMAFARSAQETLVRLRAQPPTRVPRSAGETAGPALSDPPAALISPTRPVLDTSPGPLTLDPHAERPEGGGERLPKNKAESRFQLTLLEEEVTGSERSAPKAAASVESRRLLDDGRGAFERGDYTEALRLGLRGRRRVGGRLETLAPSKSTVAEPEADEVGPGPLPPTSPDAPLTCPSCGAPLRAADAFCRACGASRAAARCGQCGEALATSDRFCGACGAPIRS
ncbi:MAG: zinc ribbon domain-containing protein [Thermoplasmata archaeon]|nr:zinc ribbon domain-containing protein [Thermoplasmata archaeon]MCI4354411.1 zinc ribbon domain-containing protein [Thermoplasmata archaeon]